MHQPLPARHVILAQLDATIGRAEHRVRWRRLVLRAMTALGRDTPTTKTCCFVRNFASRRCKVTGVTCSAWAESRSRPRLTLAPTPTARASLHVPPCTYRQATAPL